MKKYNKATTVIRFFNASYSRYIDLLRNSCYCTSQIPIPPTLLTCLPHPWNISQLNNSPKKHQLKKKHVKQNTPVYQNMLGSFPHPTKMSPSCQPQTVVPSRSVDSTLHVSHEDLRSTSPTPWWLQGSWGFMGGRLCTCGPVFWNLNK